MIEIDDMMTTKELILHKNFVTHSPNFVNSLSQYFRTL